MYHYASIGSDSKIVEFFVSSEYPADPEFDPYLIQVDAIDETWIQRKRWNTETQTWEDVLASEAAYHNSLEFTHIDANDTKHWLDDYINDLAEDVANIPEVDTSAFAAANHTHNYLPLSGGTVTGSLVINNTTDVGSSFSGGEPLIIGNPNGNHIAVDGNEIQCKDNATTAGNISINYDGGDIGLGNADVDSKIYFKNPMYIPNETVIYGQDTDGTYMSVFSAASFNDNTAVGYDRYHYNNVGKGNLNLYGKDIRLWSRDGNLVAQPLGVNQVLWSGGYLMTADHTVNLAHSISSQVNGVVLVWSCYSSNTVQDFGFATHFIPKWFATNFSGKGMDFPLMRQSAGKVGSKYLYIHDNKIVGQANNNTSGTNNGITYDNGYWVLRAVIGV